MLALPTFLFLAPWFLNAPGFRFSLSALRFQVSAFQLFASYPGVGIEVGHGEKLVAGLFDGVFHPQPLKQRALGLLLAGRDFDQAPNETGPPQVGAFSFVFRRTYGLARLRT
jgi:hypothetical protein